MLVKKIILIHVKIPWQAESGNLRAQQINGGGNDRLAWDKSR